MPPDLVRITDVAPRDGLQNEPGFVPTAAKARLIEFLAHCGADEVEATSFVSPRAIPQLADAAETLALVRARVAETPLSRRPVFSVLIPNAKGLAAAFSVHDPDTFPLKASFFTAASETFNQQNTNASIAGSLSRFAELAPAARAAGMAVRFYLSCVVRCPYEGPIAPSSVLGIAQELRGLLPAEDFADGAAELDLGETLGVATPEATRALLEVFPEKERSLLSLHLHDTHGRAAESVRVALEMGVRRFDGAAGGLGGCPFASTPGAPAPGNIATSTLVATVEDAGFRTNIDHGSLSKASRFASSLATSVRGSWAR